MTKHFPLRITSLVREWIVVREWDVKKADYVYRCYQTTFWDDKEATTICVGTGDRDWAEKNAAHFGIDIKDAP